MKYNTPDQITKQYQNLTESEKVKVMEMAFGLKEMHTEYTRTDCIALSMGYVKCVSGSGLYEKP